MLGCIVTSLLVFLLLVVGLPVAVAFIRLRLSQHRPCSRSLSVESLHLLEPADVIVVGHQSPFRSLPSGLTQMANAMTEDIAHRYWTHVAIYEGDGWVWEATSEEGVQRAKLEEKYLHRPGEIYVCVRRSKALRARPEKRAEVIRYCADRQNTPYDFYAAIYNAIVNLYPASFATIVAPPSVDDKIYGNNKFTCAELLVDAFAHAGMDVEAKSGWRVKPADFITSDEHYVDVPERWEEIVATVQAQKGTPEDIAREARQLLARDRKARSQWEKLTIEAVRMLIAEQHWVRAKALLDEILESAPGHFDALCWSGLVLGRLGDFNGAREQVSQAVIVSPGNAEAQGILGRAYKSLWRDAWDGKTLPTKTKQERAIRYAAFAKSAIESYYTALRKDICSYYSGINVVTLSALLDHLGQTLNAPIESPVTNISAVEDAVRVHAGRWAERPDRAERIWCLATMGELELVAGDSTQALEYYRKAVESTDTQPFQIGSMLDQIEMLASLDFRPQNVAPVREFLSSKASPRDPRRVQRSPEPVLCIESRATRPAAICGTYWDRRSGGPASEVCCVCATHSYC